MEPLFATFATPPIDSPTNYADPDALHACKILIIDDEAANVRMLERLLTVTGFEDFISTTDSREAAALFADYQPDLVLTDWLMPEIDGFAVIKQLRALTANDDYLPILVLTADITPETKKRALTVGATDFLTKPFDTVEAILRIKNLLNARISHLIIQEQKANLEESVRLRTIELERALTELRHSQQLIIQQERLAALGSMAGGIAHDFNNALGIITGFGEALLRDTENGLIEDSTAISITTILTAADDAAKIVHRLSEFYRSDATGEMRTYIDVNELVEQVVLLTRPKWNTDAAARGCAITMNTEHGVISNVRGDATELRAVLINLIFNAVHALPQGGDIYIRTSEENGAVVLRINDNGIGMSEEVRKRCLEPFFTTKGEAGTGLGLSMVYGIVARHAGSIDIESVEGKGTTFTLRLPSADAEHFVVRETLSRSSGPLRILVVDDQPILGELLTKALEDDLHTVETAFSGSEALEKFRAGAFDLLITDHVMAGMTGEELASAVKRINPRIPVILLTGYGGESSDGRKTNGIDLFLKKPLSRAALRHALSKLMTANIADKRERLERN